MKLDEKIRLNRISYLTTRQPQTAFKLAVLYLLLAKRQTSPRKILATCFKSIYWLSKAGISVLERFQSPNPLVLLDEIEEVLVKHRTAVAARTS